MQKCKGGNVIQTLLQKPTVKGLFVCMAHQTLQINNSDKHKPSVEAQAR